MDIKPNLANQSDNIVPKRKYTKLSTMQLDALLFDFKINRLSHDDLVNKYKVSKQALYGIIQKNKEKIRLLSEKTDKMLSLSFDKRIENIKNKALGTVDKCFVHLTDDKIAKESAFYISATIKNILTLFKAEQEQQPVNINNILVILNKYKQDRTQDIVLDAQLIK